MASTGATSSSLGLISDTQLTQIAEKQAQQVSTAAKEAYQTQVNLANARTATERIASERIATERIVHANQVNTLRNNAAMSASQAAAAANAAANEQRDAANRARANEAANKPGEVTPLVFVNRTKQADNSQTPQDAAAKKEEEDNGAGLFSTAEAPDGNSSQQDDSEGDGSGGRADAADAIEAMAGGEDDLSAEMLADILPKGDQSGVFEIVFPNGETMGVAVQTSETEVSYLMSPKSDEMASMLKRRRSELGKSLTQRTNKHVSLTILQQT